MRQKLRGCRGVVQGIMGMYEIDSVSFAQRCQFVRLLPLRIEFARQLECAYDSLPVKIDVLLGSRRS